MTCREWTHRAPAPRDCSRARAGAAWPRRLTRGGEADPVHVADHEPPGAAASVYSKALAQSRIVDPIAEATKTVPAAAPPVKAPPVDTTSASAGPARRGAPPLTPSASRQLGEEPIVARVALPWSLCATGASEHTESDSCQGPHPGWGSPLKTRSTI